MSRSSSSSFPVPPSPERRPHVSSQHNFSWVDEYAWIRSENWQDVLQDSSCLPHPIRDLLLQENAYVDHIFEDTRALEQKIFEELCGRLDEEDKEVPIEQPPFAYYSRYRKKGEMPLFCRFSLEDPHQTETILLDGDVLAQEHAFFDLHAFVPSPDHHYLAWSVDKTGAEYFTLHVKDLLTGKELEDSIEMTDGSVVWALNTEAFFYVQMDDHHRPTRVMLHHLGTAQDQDLCIFESPDPRWMLEIDFTSSKTFLLLMLYDHESSVTYLVPREGKDLTPRLIRPRQEGLRYQVDHRDDDLFICTNEEDAFDFKIIRLPLKDLNTKGETLVSHQPGRLIIEHRVFKNHLVWLEREEGTLSIKIYHLPTGDVHALRFEEEVYELSLEDTLEFDSPLLRFSYSSLRSPEEIYDYNMETRTRTLRKKQRVPSGHEPSHYKTERLFITAQDGARIPVTLLYHHTTPRDQSAPLFLYGYGSYGYSVPVSFRTSVFSLVNRGFIYAIAHVRGGTEKGWHWYQQGKLQHKTNTFSDFISVAQGLVQENYTREGQIIACGGSAGGLLIGAVANQAPVGLWGGLIAHVPFVDVLNTICDPTLPLTPPEWKEWGDPLQDPNVFFYLRSYSPYDTIQAQPYPPLLVLSGLNDPRVTYWEPTKWVARLRSTMTQGGPILLKTQMDSGHGGASGRFAYLKETALEMCFALRCHDKSLKPYELKAP